VALLIAGVAVVLLFKASLAFKAPDASFIHHPPDMYVRRGTRDCRSEIS
jgi:hypothetical protein